MLELKSYTRNELIEIFKTNRLDAIKRKINKYGYKYTDCGYGKSYILTITELPLDNELDIYCINVLKFPPQTDFSKLKPFLYSILFEDNFYKLQFNEMRAYLDTNFYIDIYEQTLSKYYNHLVDIGWIYEDNIFEFIYYVYDEITNKVNYITEEEFKQSWQEYFKAADKENECERELAKQQALNQMYFKYNGKPKKRTGRRFNGFYTEQINTTKKLLQEWEIKWETNIIN